jgi:hypothetical protein
MARPDWHWANFMHLPPVKSVPSPAISAAHLISPFPSLRRLRPTATAEDLDRSSWSGLRHSASTSTRSLVLVVSTEWMTKEGWLREVQVEEEDGARDRRDRQAPGGVLIERIRHLLLKQRRNPRFKWPPFILNAPLLQPVPLNIESSIFAEASRHSRHGADLPSKTI